MYRTPSMQCCESLSCRQKQSVDIKIVWGCFAALILHHAVTYFVFSSFPFFLHQDVGERRDFSLPFSLPSLLARDKLGFTNFYFMFTGLMIGVTPVFAWCMVHSLNSSGQCLTRSTDRFSNRFTSSFEEVGFVFFNSLRHWEAWNRRSGCAS